MTLRELFAPVGAARIAGNPETEVRGIAVDSRSVAAGDLFVALPGEKADGRAYVSEAIGRGAAAVASQRAVGRLPVPVVRLPRARRYLGDLASRIHGEPSGEMTVVGITGTNGKTTVCHLIESVFLAAGRRPGYIGTTAYRWKGTEQPAKRTTPEAADLHRLLRRMRDDGTDAVVLECSSHGLELGRLSALALDAAVFTNLTPEHLDFHGTLARYRAAKRKLFDSVLGESGKPRKVALLNADDPTGRSWARRFRPPVTTFSAQGRAADVRVVENKLGPEGLSAVLDAGGRTLAVRSKLVGRHNLSNVAAACACGLALGLEEGAVVEGIRRVEGVPGRLERVPNSRGVVVLVDYAHTEDALRNALQALDPLRRRRLIVVFGCGGDRDRAKRPRMAAAAARLADVSVITSDNPRGEDPGAIIDEIAGGLPPEVPVVAPEAVNGTSRRVALRVEDRREAIRRALRIAQKDDVVLIAGKGHETYQEVAGVHHPFDDREAARQ